MQQQFLTEMFSSDSVNPIRAFLSLPLAFALGYFISYIYRLTHRGFSYNAAFNVTLVMVTVIVTVVMVSISSNIALSLGLIGSLSIIRFRTVLKDTTDMCYVFWTIAAGLTVGSHNFVFAISATLFLGVVMVVLSKLLLKRLQGNDYVIIVQMDGDSKASATQSITDVFDENRLAWDIRSCQVQNGGPAKSKEIVYQVNERKARSCSAELLERLQSLAGIQRVSLLSSDVNQFV